MAVTEIQDSVETIDDAESGSQPAEAEGEPIQKPVSKLQQWYRSPLFNVILVGLISFTQPGIWNALNSTGAGGEQEPYLVNAANALTFGIMVFGCPLFGALANKIGLRNVLILGTLGYAPYSASLYVNNRYGTQWFVLFGATTCGLAASALWASEGAIALGYPAAKDRGRSTGIWLALRELGQIIGASIQLSLNINNKHTGKVGYATYLVLIALQCLGLPLALLLSPPQKIIRPDGSKIADPTRAKNFLHEMGKLWRLLKTKRIFLLIPILITGTWNGTYLGIYLTDYFSVRARTLGSLLAALVATVADLFWGWFLDLKVFRRSTVAKLTWAIFSVIIFIGILRAFESVGSALSYGVGAVPSNSPMTNLIVSFVLFAAAVPTTTAVTFLVPDLPVDNATAADNAGERVEDADALVK
ncbi:hypothetical protein VTN77DRAFT_3452 [Rasamsonia byssochlamydoides]|uniref:uncharacterized protein n=1 Tax=Rasamsonia byssochlamydoides TaxID=89139 RepID=UPI003743B161